MDPIIKGHQQTAEVYTNMPGLPDLRRQGKSGQTDKALYAVARQFEALFMQMMMKSMRNANMGDPLFESSRGKMFTDLHDKQLGIQMSGHGGSGLADMIVTQLKHRLPGGNRSAADNQGSGHRLPSVSPQLLRKLAPEASAGTAPPPLRRHEGPSAGQIIPTE